MRVVYREAPPKGQEEDAERVIDDYLRDGDAAAGGVSKGWSVTGMMEEDDEEKLAPDRFTQTAAFKSKVDR